LKTVGDLRKIRNLKLAAFPEFETRWLPQLASRYGVRNVDFTPLAGISAYTLLSQGKVQAAGIFTTDPQLISTKYVVLSEPRNMFGFQQVAPVVSKKLVAEKGTRLTATLNRVDSLLTLRAMIAMNKAVGLDKKPAAAVAKAFLRANKLL
jgi:osmoprotectant transport system substrate-binding protein